jgi:hypothetical protein
MTRYDEGMKKRGRPVLTTPAAKKAAWKSPAGILAGTVKITGDIVNFDTSEMWDALADVGQPIQAADPISIGSSRLKAGGGHALPHHKR